MVRGIASYPRTASCIDVMAAAATAAAAAIVIGASYCVAVARYHDI